MQPFTEALICLRVEQMVDPSASCSFPFTNPACAQVSTEPLHVGQCLTVSAGRQEETERQRSFTLNGRCHLCLKAQPALCLSFLKLSGAHFTIPA